MTSSPPPWSPPPRSPGLPPGLPPGPPPALPPGTPARGRAALVVGTGLLVVAAALALVAVVLLHGHATVTVQGRVDERDGEFPSSYETSTEVRCVAAGDGTSARYDADDDEDLIREGRGQSYANFERGLDAGRVSAQCDQARDIRISRAVESMFVALLAVVGGTAALTRRRRL